MDDPYWHLKRNVLGPFAQVDVVDETVFAIRPTQVYQIGRSFFPASRLATDDTEYTWRVSADEIRPMCPGLHGPMISFPRELYFNVIKHFAPDSYAIKSEIDGASYYTVFPDTYFKLFDEEASRYRRTKDGTIHAIKHAKLVSTPPKTSHYFGLCGSYALNMVPIVSSELKNALDQFGPKHGLRFLKATETRH